MPRPIPGSPGTPHLVPRPQEPSEDNLLHVGRHVVGLGDLSTDVVLEVQNSKYSNMLYVIHVDYIACGLHSWYKI